MEYVTNILFFITTCCIVAVTDGQKLQHLVLSESRRTGLEGTLLQVNCTAHVTAPLDSLKWVAGHEGQSDIQQTYLTNTTVVMTIATLHGSDAGRYKCLLVMADGREEIAEFELMVRRKETNSATCSITQFKCKKTKHCIFLRYRCDGKDDCGDGSDEDCESDPCLNKHRCNNSRCVDKQVLCNHVDDCGDFSDESSICFLGNKVLSTSQPNLEENQFGWLKITMSTVIASTVGTVILISFIVIVVFRVKMKKQRERRIARALESMYRHGESREATSSGQGDEAASDQRPFLPPSSHHYGNIIVNVNNGVQYLPGYDYSLFLGVPPPYSECSGASGDLKTQPPPYSTIDRNTARQRTTADCSDSYTPRQSISVSSVQNCLSGLRSADVFLPANDRLSYPGNVSGLRQAQDLEILSGVTPRFLQSLLMSHGTSVTDNSHLLAEAGVGHAARTHVHVGAGPAERSETSTVQTSDISNISQPDTTPGEDSTKKQPETNKTCDQQDNQRLFLAIAQRHDIIDTKGPSDAGAGCAEGACHLSEPDLCLPQSVTPETDPLLPGCPDILSEAADDRWIVTKPRNRNDRSPNKLSDALIPLLPCNNDAAVSIGSQVSPVAENHTCMQIYAQRGVVLPNTDERVVTGITADERVVTGITADERVVTGITADDQCTDGGEHVALKASPHPSYTSDLVQGHNASKQCDRMTDIYAHPPKTDICHTFTVGDCSRPESHVGHNTSRFNRELKVKDGCLTLETCRHTPSSMILSHLQGVYTAEQRNDAGLPDESIEAVVNTKRPSAVVTRPPLPKFNSDFVLPSGNHQL